MSIQDFGDDANFFLFENIEVAILIDSTHIKYYTMDNDESFSPAEIQQPSGPPRPPAPPAPIKDPRRKTILQRAQTIAKKVMEPRKISRTVLSSEEFDRKYVNRFKRYPAYAIMNANWKKKRHIFTSLFSCGDENNITHRLKRIKNEKVFPGYNDFWELSSTLLSMSIVILSMLTLIMQLVVYFYGSTHITRVYMRWTKSESYVIVRLVLAYLITFISFWKLFKRSTKQVVGTGDPYDSEDEEDIRREANTSANSRRAKEQNGEVASANFVRPMIKKYPETPYNMKTNKVAVGFDDSN